MNTGAFIRLMLVAVSLLGSGCYSGRAYFVPSGAVVSPLDLKPADLRPLTEHSPPAGPAFLAVSSEGMVRAVAPEGIPIAVFHVRFAFENRTGLDVRFDPGSVQALPLLRGAPPQPLAPAWVRSWGRVEDGVVKAGSEGGFDLYFAMAPPSVVSRVRGFVVRWSYRLGDDEKDVTGESVFSRTSASYYYAAGARPAPYGYYESYSIYSAPSFFWFWGPPVLAPSGGWLRGEGPGPSWIRR